MDHQHIPNEQEHQRQSLDHQVHDIGKKAIESLVSHYKQDIHFKLKSSSNDDDVPYFDPLLGRPMLHHSIPFINHWVETLLLHCVNNNNSNNNKKKKKNYSRHDYKDEIIDKHNLRVQHQKQCTTANNYIQICIDLIHSYHIHVRTQCFQIISRTKNNNNDNNNSNSNSNSNSISISRIYMERNAYLILIHYEMILFQFMHQMKKQLQHNDKEKRNDQTNDEQDDSSKISTSTTTTTTTTSIQLLFITIQSLFFDMIHLTCIDKIQVTRQKEKQHNDDTDTKDHNNNNTNNSDDSYYLSKEKKNHIVQNWILPTLLRILQHTIHLLHDIVSLNFISAKPIKTDNSIQRNNNDIQLIQKCLSYSLIAASSFCSDCNNNNNADESNNIRTPVSNDFNIFGEIISHEWKETYTLDNLMETCAYAPSHLSTHKDSNHDNNNDDDNNNNYLDKLVEHIESSIMDHHDITNDSKNQCNSLQHFLKQSSIDFDTSHASSSLKMTWLDHTKGIGFRSGRSLLEQLDTLAVLIIPLICKGNELSHNTMDMTCFDRILKATNIMDTIELVRAHFFARLDTHLVQSSPKESDDNFMKKMTMNKLAFNGISISSTLDKDKLLDNDLQQISSVKHLSNRKELEYNHHRSIRKVVNVEDNGIILDEDKPFHQTQARIVSSVRLLSSLKFPTISTEVWMHSLPIIYSLIDSNNVSHQSIGGALFLNLLNQSTPTSFLSSSGCFSNNQTKRTHALMDSISNLESAVQILSMAIRTCEEATTLVIMCAVRRRLFEIAETSNIPQTMSLRKAAVSDTLNCVNKRSYCGPNGESELVSAITANLIDVHFLLAQISSQDNAHGIEIARLSLITLLPLIRWDSSTLVGRKIQFIALSCLNSLMMGAHPIMENHGGKIMSELVSCIGRGLRDMKISRKIQSKVYHEINNKQINDEEASYSKGVITFAIHVASVALILCGKSAEDILALLENGKYLQELVDCSKLVRAGASRMLEIESKHIR